MGIRASLCNATPLECPDCARGSRTYRANAGRGRLLRLGARGAWAILGRTGTVLAAVRSVGRHGYFSGPFYWLHRIRAARRRACDAYAREWANFTVVHRSCGYLHGYVGEL